ncbi:hypothetical protein ACJMK2_029200 [Sinanodonta woodiana]|uniref:Uncharacterized protein n=1 Tax=Sinanodonta woodiana TaxID=1069815 RepID=A0ABD3XDG4_SINWO
MATAGGLIISRDTKTYNGHKQKDLNVKNTVIDLSPLPPRLADNNQESPRLQVSGPTMQARLDHVSKDEALDILHQYNDFVAGSDMKFRSLPPVNASFRSHSISPRREKDVIMRGGYAFRNSRHDNSVFTDEISKINKIPDPFFSMKTFSIPRSNLPDNISVQKENNQFILGLKASRKGLEGQHHKSSPPIYLTNEIPGFVPTINIGHSFLTSKTKQNPQSLKKSKRAKHTESSRLEPSLQSFSKNKEIARGRNSPLTPGNSFLSGKRNKKSNSTESLKNAIYENKLSVVSVGESVTPTHFKSQKIKTRKLYPMYDWQSSKMEYLRKLKFEYPEKRTDRVKSNNSNQSKVSTKLLRLEADMDATVLQPKYVKGKKGKKRKEKSKRKYDFLTFYTESGNSRKEKIPAVIIQNDDVSTLHSATNSSFHSRASTGNSSSSHVLKNPPPSIISQSQQDEIMYSGSMEPARDLRTLKEERTLSRFSRGAYNAKADTVINNDPMKRNTDPTSVSIQNHEPNKQSTKVEDAIPECTRTFDKILTIQLEKDLSKIKELKTHNPQLLSIPSISLDILAQYHSNNRNPDVRSRIPTVPKLRAGTRTDTITDTYDSSLSLKQTSVPVQNLRLDPPFQASSASTPSIHIIDEYGNQNDILHADSARQIKNECDKDDLAKVKVYNKTMSFVSPGQLESNAKRQ